MVVLNGRGTGLSASAAEAGIRFYSRSAPPGQRCRGPCPGDGFDLAWARQPSARRVERAGTGRRPVRAAGGHPGSSAARLAATGARCAKLPV